MRFPNWQSSLPGCDQESVCPCMCMRCSYGFSWQPKVRSPSGRWLVICRYGKDQQLTRGALRTQPQFLELFARLTRCFLSRTRGRSSGTRFLPLQISDEDVPKPRALPSCSARGNMIDPMGNLTRPTNHDITHPTYSTSLHEMGKSNIKCRSDE